MIHDPDRLKIRSTSAEPAAPHDKLLTVNDLADLLQVNPKTVRRMVSAGHTPPPLRIGKLIRWRPADVAAWIDAGCPRRRV